MSAYDWQPSQEDSRQFQPQPTLSVRWGSDEYINVRSSEYPDYEGPYSAIPMWEAQAFQTADHVMLDDFSVSPILELEVTNDAGGLTLTI